MYTQLEQRRMAEPPINVASLKKMKINGEPIACLTAYDASFSLLRRSSGHLVLKRNAIFLEMCWR